MDAREWRDGLKVGDPVLIGSCYYRAGSVVNIERLTPTQIVLRRNIRYRKDNGNRVGGKPYGDTLLEPTPERCDAIQHERLVLNLGAVKWKPHSLATLKAVMGLLVADEE